MDVKSKLINAVKREECLYVKKHVGYRNRTAKQQAWQRVADRVGMNVDWCEKKWAFLRQRYSREKRLENYEASDDGYEKSQWEYKDAMNFLSDYVESRHPFKNSSVKSVLDNSMDDKKVNIKKMFDSSIYDRLEYESTMDDAAEEYVTMEEDASAEEQRMLDEDVMLAEDLIVEEDGTLEEDEPIPDQEVAVLHKETPHKSQIETARNSYDIDRPLCQAITNLNAVIKKIADQQINAEERFMLTAADLMKGLPEREITLVKQKIMAVIFESRERNNI